MGFFLRMQKKQHFRLWGVDDVVYGPVDLPTLQEWAAEERVTAISWLFQEEKKCWVKAADLPSLVPFFKRVQEQTSFVGDKSKLKPSVLRRIKAFSQMTDEHLTRLVDFLDLQKVRSFTEVIRKGAPGDCMFFILEGELRARVRQAGKETILATLPQGEFFGEMALFDNGERSTDVVANEDVVLLRISLYSFQKLMAQSPEMAAPLMTAIGKTLVARIRRANRLLKNSVEFARSNADEAKPLISE